jgi:chromosome segregation ATPase
MPTATATGPEQVVVALQQQLEHTKNEMSTLKEAYTHDISALAAKIAELERNSIEISTAMHRFVASKRRTTIDSSNLAL